MVALFYMVHFHPKETTLYASSFPSFYLSTDVSIRKRRIYIAKVLFYLQNTPHLSLFFAANLMFLSTTQKNVVSLTDIKRNDMKNNDWKDRLNVVYSTNPDYQYENIGEEEAETLPKNQQKLRISMEKKGRGGKTVTLVRGFIGTEDDLKELGKLLKTKCGVGGSAKEGEIIIQGDFKQRIIDLLKAEGYTQTK